MNAGIAIGWLSPFESVIVYGHTSMVWTMSTAAAPAAWARSTFCANVQTPRSTTTIYKRESEA